MHDDTSRRPCTRLGSSPLANGLARAFLTAFLAMMPQI